MFMCARMHVCVCVFMCVCVCVECVCVQPCVCVCVVVFVILHCTVHVQFQRLQAALILPLSLSKPMSKLPSLVRSLRDCMC